MTSCVPLGQLPEGEGLGRERWSGQQEGGGSSGWLGPAGSSSSLSHPHWVLSHKRGGPLGGAWVVHSALVISGKDWLSCCAVLPQAPRGK